MKTAGSKDYMYIDKKVTCRFTKEVLFATHTHVAIMNEETCLLNKFKYANTCRMELTDMQLF